MLLAEDPRDHKWQAEPVSTIRRSEESGRD
jgi:hypothetical protein